MSTLAFIDRLSPNFDARARAIDLVVLHYTGMQSAEIALARLTDPAPVAGAYPGPWQSESAPADAPLGRVSAHYVVGEAGEIWRVVDEDARAWHAGVSSWEGEGDVNSRAIGIEIANGGHDFGLPEFPEAQISAVIALVQDILARRGLDASRVVGHSDIAPERKLDPGEKFPWRRLAEAGTAIWPKAAPVAARAGEDVVGRVQAQLKRFGYSLDQTGAMDLPTRAALMAFQRRFRPALIDGLIDEETQALLAGLALVK